MVTGSRGIMLRIHDWLFSSGQLTLAAELSDIDRATALGRLVFLWKASQTVGRSEASAQEIGIWSECPKADREKWISACVQAGFLEKLDSVLKIKGNTDEISLRRAQSEHGKKAATARHSPDDARAMPEQCPSNARVPTKAKAKAKEKEELEQQAAPAQARSLDDQKNGGAAAWKSVDASPLGLKPETVEEVAKALEYDAQAAARFAQSVKHFAFDLTNGDAERRIKNPRRFFLAISKRGEVYDRPPNYRDLWPASSCTREAVSGAGDNA